MELNSRTIKIILGGLIVLFATISYFKIPFIFFQQDEVFTLGLFMRDGVKIIFYGLGSGSLTHFAPVSLAISYLVFSLFGPEYQIYNLIGLCLHMFNGFMIFQLARKMFIDKFAPYITTLIFISSNVASELVMWPLISINSICLTFSLLCWRIVIDNNLFKKIQGYQRGLLIAITFLMALLSLEYALGLMFFIPLLILLDTQLDNKNKFKLLSPFVIMCCGYMVIKLVPLLSGGGGIEIIEQKSSLLFRLFDLIARYLGQLLVGQQILLGVSKQVANFFYTSYISDAFVENVIYRNLSISIGLLFIITSGAYLLKIKTKGSIVVKTFIILIIFISFSALPFIFIPGEAVKSAILPSRYMYFGLTGLALVYGFIYSLVQKSRFKIIKLGLLIIVILVSTYGAVNNLDRGNKLYLTGKIRASILQEITSLHKFLPKKMVIFTESNTPYYGLSNSDKIMPFQSGFGQTLLVFLTQKNRFPKEFYPGDNLWELTSQGYQEFNGQGFGYFRDKELLKRCVSEQSIPKDSLFAYAWNGETNNLEDISDRIRQELYINEIN